MAPTQSPSAGLKQSLRKLLHNDPSTLPFLRAYGMGYGLSTAPSIIRILVAYMLNKEGSKDRSLLRVLAQLFKAVVRGLSPRGFAMAFGIAVGGGKWGESRVEPVVRNVYLRVLAQATARRARGCAVAGVVSTDDSRPDIKASQILRDERNIKALSTFVSSTISSLLSITLLQSSPSYKRPTNNKAITQIDSENFGPSPYPSLTTSNSRALASKGTSNAVLPNDIVAQSPTLDITLFILVRAVDTMVRGIYEYTGVTSGRAGKAVAFIANQADTLVFSLSCWRIMWCCAFHQYGPSCVPLLTNVAMFVGRVLREGKITSFLQSMDSETCEDGSSIACFAPVRQEGRICVWTAPERCGSENECWNRCSTWSTRGVGLRPCVYIVILVLSPISTRRFVNPYHIKRLDCSVVHGKLGSGTCEVNALKRWTRAFVDALAIYGPVSRSQMFQSLSLLTISFYRYISFLSFSSTSEDSPRTLSLPSFE